MITRKEYKAARKLIRENKYSGDYSLACLPPMQEIVFSALRTISKERDKLAQRAETIAWCKREGHPYDFRLLNVFTWMRHEFGRRVNP